jgi:hypothetical protein
MQRAASRKGKRPAEKRLGTLNKKTVLRPAIDLLSVSNQVFLHLRMLAVEQSLCTIVGVLELDWLLVVRWLTAVWRENPTPAIAQLRLRRVARCDLHVSRRWQVSDLLIR